MKNKKLLIKLILSLFVIFFTAFIIFKNSSGMEVNPMGLILIGFPLFTFISAIVVQLLIKKKIIILSVVFLAYLIATFAVFNSSFLIYCPVYTVIALIGTFIADLILKCKKVLLHNFL